MAALLRSQDALDLETAIREWQSRQSGRQHDSPAPEPDEKSAVARLTTALDTLFREIVIVLSDKGKFPRDIFISLDRSQSCFSLWSDGHGVASGRLDDKFQRSRKLRQATIKTLSHLSSTLMDRLVPVVQISNPKTKRLCNQVSNILEEVNFSHVADDSSSDSTSECSTADVHELAEDLKTDVDCLIELDQMIRDPATDPEPEMTEAGVSLSSWAPHQVFADKIEHRFPGADKQLFASLGMINYQRYLRCQTERDCNQIHAEHADQPAEITAGSKFHDSGLGSSLNPASSYAETIMSYRDGNRSIRIPPLPEEAKRGDAFSCVACGRSVMITNNSQWKRHLYLDLQPYVCLDTSCQHSDSTFSSRANWLQHLALDHGMEPKWDQIKCPLCGDEIGPGKIAITTHLGQHLEEISLSALPAVPDSETNSETSDLDIDIHEGGQDGGEILQDLEALRRRMEDMKAAQEEAKREIEKAKIEAKKTARERLEAERKAEEEQARKHAEAMATVEEKARLRFEAELKATRARRPGKTRSSALVSELGNAECETEENHETGENGERRRPRRAAAPKWSFEQPAVDTGNSTSSATPSRRGWSAKAETNMKSLQGQADVQFVDQRFNQGAQRPDKQAFQNMLANLPQELRPNQLDEVIQRWQNRPQENMAMNSAQGSPGQMQDGELGRMGQMSPNMAHGQAETTAVPNGTRHEVSDTTAGVEHGKRLDDWQTRRWRWICPSCGSEEPDQRKGPVCSNCSYLLGDGDGFVTYVPGRHQPQDDEIVTEEQLQEQHQSSSEHQAASTSLERAPQAEHQYSSQHAEQSVSDSTNVYPTNKQYMPEHDLIGLGVNLSSTTATQQWATANKSSLLFSPVPVDIDRSASSTGISSMRSNASNLERRAAEARVRALQAAKTIQLAPKPNSDAENVPGQLNLIEPSVGIDIHTAAAKKKLDPIRLGRSNPPLPDLDLDSPKWLSQELPPFKLGDIAGMNTVLPSLNAVHPASTGPGKDFSKLDEDWFEITDPTERRRISNRIAQRAYRRKMKERLEDLEKRAVAAEAQGSEHSDTTKDGPLDEKATSSTRRERENHPGHPGRDRYQVTVHGSGDDTSRLQRRDFPRPIDGCS